MTNEEIAERLKNQQDHINALHDWVKGIDDSITASKAIEETQAEEDVVASSMAEVVKFTDSMRAFVKDFYTSARTYTTVVVGGGYAAALTLWNYLHAVAPSQTITFAGLCLLISVIGFVFPETWNAIKVARLNMRMAKVNRPLPADASLDDRMKQIAELGKVMGAYGFSAKLHFVQVLASVLPALFAAIVMLIAYVTLLLA